MSVETIDEQKELSRYEIDVGLYSWRYPTLYSAMLSGEDLEMAATRIIDDNQVVLEDIENALNSKENLPSDEVTKTVNEAYMFLRDEIAARNNTNNNTKQTQ